MTELMPHKTDTGLTWPHPLPTCWCLTDGRPGMENQAVGLAEAMGLTPVVKRVILKTPWRIASPHVTAFKRFAFSKKGDPVDPPWPDILIATGGRASCHRFTLRGKAAGERSRCSFKTRFRCAGASTASSFRLTTAFPART